MKYASNSRIFLMKITGYIHSIYKVRWDTILPHDAYTPHSRGVHKENKNPPIMADRKGKSARFLRFLLHISKKSSTFAAKIKLKGCYG